MLFLVVPHDGERAMVEFTDCLRQLVRRLASVRGGRDVSDGSGRAGTRRTVAIQTAVVVLAAVLLTACPSASGMPEGFERTMVGPVTFGRPAGWEQVPDEQVMGRAAAQFNAPGDDTGLTGAIVVFTDRAYSGDLELEVDAALESYRLSFTGFELVDQGSVEVNGAEEAVLVEYRYRTDADEPARSFDLFVRSAYADLLFRVAGLDGRLDADQAQRIVDTVTIGG